MSVLKAMRLALTTPCASIPMDHLTVFVDQDFSFRMEPVRVITIMNIVLYILKLVKIISHRHQ